MDDIQRKLAQIDRQLAAGPANLHKKIISTCPLVFIAVGLIAGILIQSTLFESRATGDESRFIWPWLILLILLTAATVCFFIIQHFSSTTHQSPITNNHLPVTNYQYVTAYLALACFVCLGAIRLSSFHQPKPNDVRNFVTDQPRLATIRGLIVTEPFINKNQDWQFGIFKPTDPTSSFYLKVSEVKTAAESPLRRKSWAKVSGIVRVQVDEPVLDLKAGDYIQAYCWLDRFNPPTNPGQFNTAKYLARKNVFIAASVPSRDAFELLKKKNSTGTFIKIKRRLQEIAGQALRGDLDIEGQNYALMQALVLGYRTKIDSDTYRAFQKTGLLHFLCLSGMNFVILFWIIWWLCKTAGLMKRSCAVICLAATGLFLLVVPPQPPAFRAAIMSSVFCVSFFFRRKYNPFNALSLAAVILLLIKPTELFDEGWQLSFTVVLGLLLFCVRIHFFLYEKITGMPWSKKVPKTGLIFRVVPIAGPYLLQLFSTSLTAWLSSVGFSLYHFYRINYLTSIWTVIVAPLIGFISVIGYFKMILALFLPNAAALLDIIIGPLVSLLIWLVKFMDSLNISEMLIGKVSLTVVILYYAFLLFAFFVHFRRPFVKKLICVASASVIIAFLGVIKWQRTNRDNLVLTCLDVGHGQAILAQLPGKANVLFDAGSFEKTDIGRRVIAPFLDSAGTVKIDAIIISHNDIDHINGIPEVVEHCKVDAIYANDAFFDKAEQQTTIRFLNESLSEKDFEIENLKDLNLNSAAKIKILWPTEQVSQDEQLGDNDKSLVSLIEFAGTKILLCSDIEKFAQKELLRLNPDLKADVVVVPHHGSSKTADPDFLKNLDADILICSCGQRQYETTNHATAGTSGDTNKAKSFYTPKDGAITISITKRGKITTITFLKNQ